MEEKETESDITKLYYKEQEVKVQEDITLSTQKQITEIIQTRKAVGCIGM